MSEIAELRGLQSEYVDKRDHCYALIRKQDNDLRNCMPSASTIRACREREANLRAAADEWQRRIDAIQRKIDEEIGLKQTSENMCVCDRCGDVHEAGGRRAEDEG